MGLIIEKNSLVHIVPSGLDRSLCGIKNPLLESSLGCSCTCDDCYRLAEKLISLKTSIDNKK